MSTSRLPDPDSSRPEAEAVRTFAFEVNAGRTAKPEDAALPLAVGPAVVAKTPAEVGDEVRRDVTAPTPALHVDENRPAANPMSIVIRPKPVARRQSSWWSASLCLHVVMLLFLAFTTLVVRREEKLDLYAGPVVYEEIEKFDELEIVPTAELESLEDQLTTELEEPSLTELDIDPMPLPSLTGEPASAGGDSALTDLSALLGDGVSGLTDLGTGSGTGHGSGTGTALATGTMAKFFGTEVYARRILYMLDNSGGMRKGGKFEALVSELQASINALDRDQQFYIIFYSDTVYPLFFPRSVRRFVQANERNRTLLAQWLNSVELCGGNAIDEALAAAAVIRPEVVFLLTDGDLFTTDKKRALLLNRAGRPYPIHTFGLGVDAETNTATRLRQVADANGGTFRAIPISAEMKSLAREKERPYHSKKPGPVWGINVGKW